MLQGFREIVLVDTEFEAGTGERPAPVCLVAKELRSGRVFRIFQGEFGTSPPYATGPDVLFVAYYASAELGCYHALGWPMPERILDLFVEFRHRTNGLPTPAGAGELGALIYFGLDHMDAVEKKTMQEAIGSGAWRGRYTPEQVLDYCERDVLALERLLPVMLPKIDSPRALLRGRYMAALSGIEWNGVPIDTHTLARLREGWTGIQDRLIAAIDADYHVYDGRTFKLDCFERWLIRHNIPWPLLESGRLDLCDDTFRQMAKAYPPVSPLRELRSSLSSMRLNDLKVGHDKRNRAMLSAFRARTSRNQPSSSEYIFGNSVWLRGLIEPPPGYGLGYVDWGQQEFGIAAYLSGDANMIAAYISGDCYLAFGKQAGLIPPDGTKLTHKFQRELCKQCILGVQYGMGAYSLAMRIGQPVIVASDLLRLHRETYAVFWRWSDAVVDTAMSTNLLHSTFGWHLHIGENPNPRSLRNHLMQTNGAEMMRIAACLATERGIEVCAPVHDAFLICAPLDRLDEDIARMRQAMAEASRAVLGGFEIGTDVSITRFPDRYMDDRGKVMWARVLDLLPQEPQRLRATA
jgi:DNA polymerase family A